MVIPALMNSTAESEYKTGYKKAYSVASQAWMQAVADDKIESRPTWEDSTTKADNFNSFKSYFKVVKDCNSDNNSDCWASGEMYFGLPDSSALAFVDASGFAWSLPSETVGGANLFVDINGNKKPNKWGQDRFTFLPLPENLSMTDYTALEDPTNLVGLPTKLAPIRDYTSKDANICPSGDVHPCYYSSWLYGK